MELLFFFHFDSNAPTIKAALGAHAMWRARLAAVRAIANRRRHQMIVRPALARARLRMFPFRIWHYKLLDNFNQLLLFNSFSVAQRASTSSNLQTHSTSFRFTPHSGHSP